MRQFLLTTSMAVMAVLLSGCVDCTIRITNETKDKPAIAAWSCTILYVNEDCCNDVKAAYQVGKGYPNGFIAATFNNVAKLMPATCTDGDLNQFARAKCVLSGGNQYPTTP